MKNIIYCLPGRTFTKEFLHSWTSTILETSQRGYQFRMSCQYSAVVYFARNQCLGGSTLRGKKQKPFNGEIPYSHIVWIDSDIVWNPKDIFKLIDHDKDIIAGNYIMENNTHYTTVIDMKDEEFMRNGTYKFMSRKDLKKKKKIFKADYTGLGFMVIKSGVFEQMEYPWFRPIYKDFNEDVVEFTSEDVGFCGVAKSLGIDIWIDPTVHVGHQKSIVLT